YCGPWFQELFPGLIGSHLTGHPVGQEVAVHRPPRGHLEVDHGLHIGDAGGSDELGAGHGGPPEGAGPWRFDVLDDTGDSGACPCMGTYTSCALFSELSLTQLPIGRRITVSMISS